METVHAVVLLNQAIWSRGNWMIGLWISFSHTCLGDVTNKPLKDFFFSIYSLLHRFKSKHRSVDWLTQSNCDYCFCSEFQSLPHMAAAFYDDKDNKPRNRASKSMDLGEYVCTHTPPTHTRPSVGERSCCPNDWMHFPGAKTYKPYCCLNHRKPAKRMSPIMKPRLCTHNRDSDHMLLSVHFFVVIRSPLPIIPGLRGFDLLNS